MTAVAHAETTLDGRRSTATASVFLGVLLLLAAWAAYATSVYGEDATNCLGLALRNASEPADCSVFNEVRQRLVAGLSVLGCLLIVVGLAALVTRPLERPTAGGPVEGARTAVVVAGLAQPLVRVLVMVPALIYLAATFPGDGQPFHGLPAGWGHLFDALSVFATCAFATRLGPPGHGLSAQGAMAAAAVALPLVTGLRAALGFLLEPGTRDEVRFTGDPLAVVLSGVPVALALWIAVALQNRGRAAPPLWVSAALGAVSAFAGTLVVVPDVLQRWRDPCCDPGRGPTPGTDVWVPQLVAPTLIAMVVVGLVVLLAKRRPPA